MGPDSEAEGSLVVHLLLAVSEIRVIICDARTREQTWGWITIQLIQVQGIGDHRLHLPCPRHSGDSLNLAMMERDGQFCFVDIAFC
ncbi:hypothetical protein EJ110_NYTH22240 [Nymphaea thermarum]|nr:hypothetical protein EJ110_NYTH22240 [Nymphaea thermarum]